MTEDADNTDTPGGFSGDPQTTGDVDFLAGDVAEFEPHDWQRALSASVAAYAARQAARRAERDEFAVRRKHGLVARHAAKLAHNRSAAGRSDGVSIECQPPTEAQLSEPSPDGKTGIGSFRKGQQ